MKMRHSPTFLFARVWETENIVTPAASISANNYKVLTRSPPSGWRWARHPLPGSIIYHSCHHNFAQVQVLCNVARMMQCFPNLFIFKYSDVLHPSIFPYRRLQIVGYYIDSQFNNYCRSLLYLYNIHAQLTQSSTCPMDCSPACSPNKYWSELPFTRLPWPRKSALSCCRQMLPPCHLKPI